MKFHCKCGQCLTGDLQRAKSHTDGLEIVKSTVVARDEKGDTVINDYAVKLGIYYRRRFKGKRWCGPLTKNGRHPNTYRINPDSLINGCITNTSKGCCRWDYFEVKCPACGIVVGEGRNDCWQTVSADLVRTKVKLK